MQVANSQPMPDLPVVVYSPESPLRHPIRLIREIFSEVWSARELIHILFMRDLKAQYRRSLLGYFWVFAPTIGTTLTWTYLSSQHVIHVSQTSVPYPVYVLIGSILWSFFTAAVNQPLTSFHSGCPVFTKLKVPPEAFIAAGIAHVLFELAVRLLVLLPFFLLYRLAPPLTALLFPVVICCLLLFSLMIGILLIPLGSLYSDVSRLTGMVLAFGMYLTPVIYPPAQHGLAASVVNLNPLTSFIVAARDSLTVGTSSYFYPMLGLTALSFFGLVASLIVFRVALPHLVVRMGM